MVNKDNIEQIVLQNKKLLDSIGEKIERVKNMADPLMNSGQPIEFIKTYLDEQANVIVFPVKNKNYGGLVYYFNSEYYIHINSAQPKIYEDFMWAHEFYHFMFDKDKIKSDAQQSALVDYIHDNDERIPNLFAAEILINKWAIERSYKYIERAYVSKPLEEKIMYLVPIFKVPYKALVIKLLQEGLISVEEAKRCIDYPYMVNIPDDMDPTYFRPSNTIRIDKIDSLIEKAYETMYEEDIESIVDKKRTLYKKLLMWKDNLGGDKDVSTTGYSK